MGLSVQLLERSISAERRYIHNNSMVYRLAICMIYGIPILRQQHPPSTLCNPVLVLQDSISLINGEPNMVLFCSPPTIPCRPQCDELLNSCNIIAK